MRSIVDHQMMPALYEFLRATRPYRRWGLPPASEVHFTTLRKHAFRGDFTAGDARNMQRIRLSTRHIAFTDVALRTMAHEMIHLHLQISGCRESDHGANFKRLAKRVCRVHGWDPLDF